jgi:hypothetical protein
MPLDEPQRLDPKQRMERFRELREVTDDHPFVRDVAYMYARGDIVTFEEALQQIICRLIKYYSRFEEGYRDMLRYNVQPIIIPADKLADFQAELKDDPPPTATGETIAEKNGSQERQEAQGLSTD